MVLQSGDVSFLFTDVVGSTRLWAERPEAMAADLERHDGLLRAAIEGHGGRVFSTAGDAFAAAFGTASDAVAAAVEAQRQLGGVAWASPAGLAVRMGIHAGEAVERDGDYFGPTLNTAARLMSTAHGGQIVVSGQVVELGTGAQTYDLGEHRLRDIPEPLQVHQVVEPGLVEDFPPISSIGAFTNTLPQHRSSFVGRAVEIDRVRRLLGDHRLVTITGVGGVGKTRVAVEIGAAELAHYPGGVFFVDLAATDKPEGIAVAVGAGIGLGGATPETLRTDIDRFLANRRVLLVLDNCEHLLDPIADLVDDLLADSPELVVLATSREALEIEGEETYRLPSLDTEESALRLFVERATSVYDGFELNDANRSTTTELCRRLDGIPLAIELAASRARTFTPTELLERLDDRFTVLRGGRRRGVLPRQRTLEAAIGWSFDLLDEDEQVFFRRLAVFGGPFVFEVLPAITEFSESEAVDLLESLVAKSLVVPVEIDAEQRAFRLLETVRAFATDQLADAGETDETADRHADVYVDLCRSTDFVAAGMRSWIRSYRTQIGEMWSAADRLIGSDRSIDAVEVLRAGGPAVAGTMHNPEMLRQAERLDHAQAGALTSSGQGKLLGLLANCQMAAGQVLDLVATIDRGLREAADAPFEDRAVLMSLNALQLSVLQPAAAAAYLAQALEPLGNSPQGQRFRRFFDLNAAYAAAMLRHYDEAVTLCAGSFEADDSFRFDLGMAALLWAAHLADTAPPPGATEQAATLSLSDEGWTLSPLIAAAMWSSPDQNEIARRLIEIADQALTGRLPFAEAEFLIAFARLAHLRGDDARCLELLNVTATRSPWIIFILPETQGSIEGWSDEDWETRRLAQFADRIDPDRQDYFRDQGPIVLAAEMDLWR